MLALRGAKAESLFYGRNPPLERICYVHAPILGLYDGDYTRITTAVSGPAKAVQRAGKSFD